MKEAQDFLEECRSVSTAISNLSDEDYNRATQFKEWTIYDIMAHLHLWNMAADWTLNSPDKFAELMGDVIKVFQGGKTHQDLSLIHI